ncbi:MAG: terminase TerL endonuclease subunit [Candidatus Aminicenantales bacterium]|jgi:phage terminase large subunit-like protein
MANGAKKKKQPEAPQEKKRGGGWNRKTIAEHVRDGTYRADRHGAIAPATAAGKKPPGKVTASARSQSRWITGPADEHAVRAGCRFNERLAVYVCDWFARNLCHTKGQWRGDPFILNAWQREKVVYPLFGWVREDGTRRFRRSYIEIPKKNYKSTMAAGVGLHMLAGDEEPGAENWSLGGDKSQARVVHDDAVQMAENSPLAAVLKIHHSTFNIAYPATNSYYRAVSAAPRGKHGPSLHCAIADELHEWYGDELWKSIRYSFRARRQPLLLVITNAGNNLQSLCYRQREKARAILDGSTFDDDFFALILSATREEAEAEIEAVKAGATELPVARRCNPGLGHVIQERDLVQDIRDAIQTPSELPNLLRLTYGIWDTAVSPWLSTADWEKCGADFCEEDLAGRRCHEALDLSLTGDMSAAALVFPMDQDEEETGRQGDRETRSEEDEDAEHSLSPPLPVSPSPPPRYRQLVHFWIPEKTVQERQHLVDYRAWEKAGWLTIVPGAVIEYGMIREALAEIHSRFEVLSFSYDKMYASDTAQWVTEHFPEIEVAEFPQNIMAYAGPTAEYERLVLGGQLHHNKNALLTWQAGHCKVLTDTNRNKRPVKPKANDIRSIDGIIAGVMALGRAWQPEAPPSAYETPDDEEPTIHCAEDLMEEEDRETGRQGDKEPDEELSADTDNSAGADLPAESAEPGPRPRKRGRKTPIPNPQSPIPSALASAAIETVDAGQKVECTRRAYHATIRQVLQGHAIRLADADQTERCARVLAEIRRLDELHGE